MGVRVGGFEGMPREVLQGRSTNDTDAQRVLTQCTNPSIQSSHGYQLLFTYTSKLEGDVRVCMRRDVVAISKPESR